MIPQAAEPRIKQRYSFQLQFWKHRVSLERVGKSKSYIQNFSQLYLYYNQYDLEIVGIEVWFIIFSFFVTFFFTSFFTRRSLHHTQSQNPEQKHPCKKNSSIFTHLLNFSQRLTNLHFSGKKNDNFDWIIAIWFYLGNFCRKIEGGVQRTFPENLFWKNCNFSRSFTD